MTQTFVTLVSALSLAACAQEPAAPSAEVPATPVPSASTNAAPMPQTDAGKTFPTGAWDMVSSGEGDGLFFAVTEGEPGAVHVFCPSGGGMLVNVNAFRPIGSEERMTFGSGGTLVTLVADPAGDTLRGGVSGQGPVPGELPAILTGAAGVSVNYGAQDIGPLPPVPASVARDFVAGCSD